jgi:dimeric dUTPase (all-alpha-NTP-PPase superfamily)
MLNPENKCAQLITQDSKELTLKEMFEMQLSLQKEMFRRGKGIDYVNGDFKDKVDNITIQYRNLNTEFVELLERLPFKEWKTYSQSQMVGWISKEQELETKFEYVDMWHFFMNIGLLIGITPEELTKMYYLKNKENFDRQERGY